ncbi:Pentatricopeptide repeat-containing protein [Acorus gramineus]|uniref:Pentatricopeptide repeat-containing protein n=1 Tax=Acorus gramineus TaxID=55184 RepID=A0AAV9ABR2_ACOGR|nr:Pentatricopeptide repeat-containing protein [Acorus gramineus]
MRRFLVINRSLRSIFRTHPRELSSSVLVKYLNLHVHGFVDHARPEIRPIPIQSPCLRHCSTDVKTQIDPGRSKKLDLQSKLEMSIKDGQLDEAWEAFEEFISLYGFPKLTLLTQFIVLLSYSSDPLWLQKAYDVVLTVLEKRPGFLHPDSLSRLALNLARIQMPVPSATLLRVMLDKENLPSVDVLSSVFLHMVKTHIGSCLASDILIEICEHLLRCERKERISTKWKIKVPSTTVFNLVLNSCVQYESFIKAQQLLNLMPQMGIVADAGSIVVIAKVYQMIGHRDELMKMREIVDRAPTALNCHYWQYYDCLLRLHFKFDDVASAAQTMLDLYVRALHRDDGFVTEDHELQKPNFLSMGSSNLGTNVAIMVKPELLRNDLVLDSECCSPLVSFIDGTLVPTDTALAKLINACKRAGNVGALSSLLVRFQRELGVSDESSLSFDIVGACIQLGWLETAHDILDDLKSASVPVAEASYMSLLSAYCKRKQFGEAKVLLKQMKKIGLLENLPDEEVIETCDGAIPVKKSMLGSVLLRVSREEEPLSPMIYEINSSIFFFWRAKMMEDALKSFRRMTEMNLQPTVQTFSHLVYGYASLKMYSEITFLWGDIRRRMESGGLPAERDLLEFVLLNFIKGGYFARVLEIISYMSKHRMFADKLKYKREFLKLYKNLYRNLKTEKARTAAQSKRLEHVTSFRKYVGID